MKIVLYLLIYKYQSEQVRDIIAGPQLFVISEQVQKQEVKSCIIYT